MHGGYGGYGAPAFFGGGNQGGGGGVGAGNSLTVFIGDIPMTVQDDEVLRQAFEDSFPGINIASVHLIKDAVTKATKGFGFVSFLDPFDCARALKEMNGKYIGNRPVKLRKSVWDRRAFTPNNKKKRKKGKGKESATPEETPEENGGEEELNI